MEKVRFKMLNDTFMEDCKLCYDREKLFNDSKDWMKLNNQVIVI